MLAQETGTAVKSFHFIITHSFFCCYLLILLCIWSYMLFPLKESRKRSFIFDNSEHKCSNCQTLMQRESEKREGEMDGWRGWKEL